FRGDAGNFTLEHLSRAVEVEVVELSGLVFELQVAQVFLDCELAFGQRLQAGGALAAEVGIGHRGEHPPEQGEGEDAAGEGGERHSSSSEAASPAPSDSPRWRNLRT